MNKTSDLRDDTASRIFAIFMEAIARNLYKSELSDEEITKQMIKIAPENAKDAIELANIFVMTLEQKVNP